MTSQPLADESRTETGADGVECCEASHDLSEAAVRSDVEVLAALGNDTRYETLRLVAAAEGQRCVCELEPSLGVSQSAVSQALSRLYSAGLVSKQKKGRWRYYAATPRAERLLAALDAERGEGDV